MFKYEASVDGKIFRNGKEMKQCLHHTGYLVVSIRNRQWRSHRFIWVFFNGDIPNGLVVNHKNGIKTDNRLDNLEVVTNKENTIHAYSLGLMKGRSGEENPMTKLTNEQVMKMFSEFKTNSNDQIARMYNLHPRYVSLIRHKRRWKKLWMQYEGSETMVETSRPEVGAEAPSPEKE